MNNNSNNTNTYGGYYGYGQYGGYGQGNQSNIREGSATPKSSTNPTVGGYSQSHSATQSNASAYGFTTNTAKFIGPQRPPTTGKDHLVQGLFTYYGGSTINASKSQGGSNQSHSKGKEPAK